MTLEDKKYHPWAGRICDNLFAFAIDGRYHEPLILRRGKNYRFHVKVDLKTHHAQPFYFTKDPAGGMIGDTCESGHDPVELPGTDKPIANGVIVLKVTKDLPKHFYFQSRQCKFLGGPIFVED